MNFELRSTAVGVVLRRRAYRRPLRRRGRVSLLLLDNNTEDARTLSGSLRMVFPGEHEVVHATTLVSARRYLSDQRFDVACVRLQAEFGGLDSVVRLQAEQPTMGIIVILDGDDDELALQAVQAGAQDCLIRTAVDGPMLAKALRYAKERKRAELALSQVAVHDQVTGLANRTLFRQRIAQALIVPQGARPSFAIFLG